MELSQLSIERDQLVRQLEKSQDMLLSFQQDLNLTEAELKRTTAENRRLKDESDKSERGVLESKETEIRILNDKVRTMEYEYDEALQKHARAKIDADKFEREANTLRAKVDQLEQDIKLRRRESATNLNANNDANAKFDIEIARLTKERDAARTELNVCKRDLDNIELELKRKADENARLRSDADKAKEGMEKGSKEILEAKDREIAKLTERTKTLEKEVAALTKEKELLEKQKTDLEKALTDSGKGDAAKAAENEKKIAELTEQIKVCKADLEDKTKEFNSEKADLKKVVDETKEKLKKAEENAAKAAAATTNGEKVPADMEKVKKDLEKAQKEVQEAAIEKERFQSQLEMLVQELEQKQVGFRNSVVRTSYNKPFVPSPPLFRNHLSLEVFARAKPKKKKETFRWFPASLSTVGYFFRPRPTRVS